MNKHDWAIVLGMMVIGWALVSIIYAGVIFLLAAIK